MYESPKENQYRTPPGLLLPLRIVGDEGTFSDVEFEDDVEFEMVVELKSVVELRGFGELKGIVEL